jgi:YD repeat-containing protein
MVDSTGTTTYAYDHLYRPISITSPTGTTSYTYDANNRLSLTTPAGTTTYQYDAADQLIQVMDWEANTTAYAYDAAGRLITTTLPNGVVTTNAYDIADRLTSITHKKGTTTLESFTYTLDPVGNRLSMADADGTTTYTYDALDRILTVTYPSGAPGTVAYTYDPMGNRLTMAQDGVVTSYTYDAADRLVSKTTAGVPPLTPGTMPATCSPREIKPSPGTRPENWIRGLMGSHPPPMPITGMACVWGTPWMVQQHITCRILPGAWPLSCGKKPVVQQSIICTALT